MTAPDVNADVRARFEAWLLDREIKTPRRPNGYYQSDETCFWWRLWQDAYRAAHADLSGEVRELVEELANDLESALEAKRGAELDRRIDRDLDVVRRARTMLAKFTHQEKP